MSRRRDLPRFPASLLHVGKRSDAGYIAVITAILIPVIFGLAALSIDVGNWYVVAQQEQRAADAAALAGVTYMPGDFTSATSTATSIASVNGFTANASTTVTVTAVTGSPSKLQVTIKQVVNNTFGSFIGTPKTTITRTAVANYQAPLAMGSPCNEFGNGPNPANGGTDPQRSANCSAAGQFWANIGSPQATKVSGDAYQDGVCGGGVDGCSGSTNSDYANDGYFYTVKVTAPVTNLTLEAFDPAFVAVGDTCTSNFGSGTTASTVAKNQYNYNASTSWSSAAPTEDTQLYASGSGTYCTGDNLINGTVPPDTTYTVRQPVATSNPWDPTSYPVVSGCTKTFTGFSGDLYTALNQYQQNSSGQITYTGKTPKLAPTGTNGYQSAVAQEFRQWVPLCTISGTAMPGTYFIQVQTDASGDNSNGSGHNRFALRAEGALPLVDNLNIAISGYNDMAVYNNTPSGTTTFYLAQVAPAAAGQILDVRLFDIGDGTTSGSTAQVVPPADSNIGGTFTGCTGAGVTNGNLTNCTIPVSSSYNGKWQEIQVPIPTTYTCNSSAPTGCWITLKYYAGPGSQPSDTTSWQVSLEGTPVRLTQ